MVRPNTFPWSVIPDWSVDRAYFWFKNLAQSSSFLLMFRCSSFVCFDANTSSSLLVNFGTWYSYLLRITKHFIFVICYHYQVKNQPKVKLIFAVASLVTKVISKEFVKNT